MGNECSLCNKSSAELNQIVFYDAENFNGVMNKNHSRQNILSMHKGDKDLQRYSSHEKSKKDLNISQLINKNPENYKKFELIKQFLLKYKDKRFYNILQNKQREEEKYFKFAELKETLENKKLKDLKIKTNFTYKYKSGAVYTGEWLGGFRHGKGKMTWSDNVYYEGNWSFGYAEGEGILSIPNGDYMKGHFMNNQLNGYGEIHNSQTGYEYQGNFFNDKQHGKGKETLINGSSFDGFYDLGKKDGVGKYIWEDGTKYIGEWKDNKIHGLGIYLWSDGRKYIGSWKNSKMHGVGMFSWQDGKTFLGDYLDDKRNNFGIFTDGAKKYEGFWKNGNKNFLGRQTKKDGSFKLGFWDNNTMTSEITDENEYASKLSEIDNFAEETKKKIAVVFQAFKVLLVKTRPDFCEELNTLLQ